MIDMENKQYLSDTCVFDRDVYENTQSEGNHPGILRVIKGPVAEWNKLNRNKRKYSEKLWDKTLSSPYVQEQLKYKTLYGEANHPTDRYEVDFMRVSHLITELWKVPASDQIYATINILDTPAGKILNTLYEAGGVIGYSSRAGGTLTSRKGYVDVDEDSYNFVTFDAVPFPSVESARPSVVEGVEVEIPKAQLSDETHERLCKIISESSSYGLEVVKDIIYSLDGYDLSKEIKLLEGTSPIGNKDESEKETTMSLLRESSLQIDKLKSENQILQAAKSSLEKENSSLKEGLNSSLGNIAKLMNESKSLESTVSESEHRFNDTIKGLERKICELESELEDKDLELGHLDDVHIAYKAVVYENKRLKSESQSLLESVSSNASVEYNKIKSELNEACLEVSRLLDEAERLEEQTEKYKEEIETLKRKNEELLDKSNKSASRLTEGLDRCTVLEGENKELKGENRQLRGELKELSESVESLRDRTNSYKDDLISVICSKYNLTVELVKENLSTGFTKSDIYLVCEELSNSMKNGISYSRIVDEAAPVQAEKSVDEQKHSPSIPFVNRRGIGIL